MIWFKPEVVTTINWAGNPDKPVEFGTGGIMEISPRKSFDIWSQTVECTSTAWKKEDFKSALQLKEEVTFAISRKAAEIRRLNEKLNEAYNELDAFSYTISHDLKNPLTSIKSYSEILTEFFSLEPKAQSMVDGILKSANKMQKMIEEVLNYSRMGQARIKPKVVNMDKILDEIRQELLIVNQKPRLQITIGNTPDLFGDETMVMQVFSNLISNAVKYSGETYESSVTINGEDTGKAIQYTVTDNGIGIKAADHERIFELFTRSDEVKDYEGSGVGLSIVKKIMEKHRGKIWLKSEVNTGSTFYVSFNKYENPPALN
jgi:chemotaxis family two-component system sensor kinase Cph1